MNQGIRWVFAANPRRKQTSPPLTVREALLCNPPSSAVHVPPPHLGVGEAAGMTYHVGLLSATPRHGNPPPRLPFSCGWWRTAQACKGSAAPPPPPSLPTCTELDAGQPGGLGQRNSSNTIHITLQIHLSSTRSYLGPVLSETGVLWSPIDTTTCNSNNRNCNNISRILHPVQAWCGEWAQYPVTIIHS
jgi:hypothetical protein